MPNKTVEFAVFGASPLAFLLVGLLTERHGKTVVQIAEPEARYRLPRSMDLSIAPLTRPETWSLLTRLVPEAQKLITRIASRHALRRIDPILFADRPEGEEALGHVVHMAQAYGLMVDRVAASKLGASRMAFRFGDALTIDRQILLPGLEKWLSNMDVRRVAPDLATLHSDGTAEIKDGEETIHAARSILVDDAAIMHILMADHWPGVIQRRPHASILISAKGRLTSQVMISLDSGMTLMQLDGSVAAAGPGTLPIFSASLAQILADRGVSQQIGQSSFDALLSSDGAPVIGAMSDSAPIILTCLGPTSTFFAPLLARWLAGSASEDEAAWCDLRTPRPVEERHAVAEFAVPPGAITR